MSKKPATLVVLSGGQDSTTCLFNAIADAENEYKTEGKSGTMREVHAVTFNYGQRHQRELDAAHAVFCIAKNAHPQTIVSHEVVDVGPILVSSSPLVSGNELEQYADHNSLPGGIEKTFVPLRNMLFLTLAANRAVAMGADRIVTGVCQEDFGGYPDCRRVFIDAVQKAVNLSNEGAAAEILIETPLMFLTKAQSVDLAVNLSLCGYNAYGALAYSHTSYDGRYPPVGHDHATLLRAKGFIQANTPDPLVLRAHKEGLMGLPKTRNYEAGPEMDKYQDLIEKAVL